MIIKKEPLEKNQSKYQHENIQEVSQIYELPQVNFIKRADQDFRNFEDLISEDQNKLQIKQNKILIDKETQIDYQQTLDDKCFQVGGSSFPIESDTDLNFYKYSIEEIPFSNIRLISQNIFCQQQNGFERYQCLIKFEGKSIHCLILEQNPELILFHINFDLLLTYANNHITQFQYKNVPSQFLFPFRDSILFPFVRNQVFKNCKLTLDLQVQALLNKKQNQYQLFEYLSEFKQNLSQLFFQTETILKLAEIVKKQEINNLQFCEHIQKIGRLGDYTSIKSLETDGNKLKFFVFKKIINWDSLLEENYYNFNIIVDENILSIEFNNLFYSDIDNFLKNIFQTMQQNPLFFSIKGRIFNYFQKYFKKEYDFFNVKNKKLKLIQKLNEQKMSSQSEDLIDQRIIQIQDRYQIKCILK